MTFTTCFARSIDSRPLLWPPLLISMYVFDAVVVAAQNDTSDYDQPQMALEEVIVTARKREEDLQDTPVAVSAFSAEALRSGGHRQHADLQESVPGLVFSE